MLFNVTSISCNIKSKLMSNYYLDLCRTRLCMTHRLSDRSYVLNYYIVEWLKHCSLYVDIGHIVIIKDYILHTQHSITYLGP